MMADKILIVDDKPDTEQRSTERILCSLKEEQRSLVIHVRDIAGCWKDNGDDVVLLRDFTLFSYVFIHDSFDDPIIIGGLKELLIRKLMATSHVVLFSGEKDESAVPRMGRSLSEGNIFWYELRRDQYVKNLGRFIESSFFFGEYKVKYLYDRYSSPLRDKAEDLIIKLRGLLEDSVLAAARSAAFRDLLDLLGYSEAEKIIARFSIMSDGEFSSALENLIK